MKVIDQSPVREDNRFIDRIKAYLTGISKYGWGWTADIKAEETIIASLQQYIDNSYIMIRNLLLEGIDSPIPLVLVGPSGIYVLLASGVKGVFRARNEIWMEMNRKSRKYTPVRKNLISRAQLMTRVVDYYLTQHQCPHPPIQTAMLFGAAGAHVDSTRSAVRVVLKDGMESLASSVMQGDVVLKNREDVQEVVDFLIGNLPVQEEVSPEPVLLGPRKPKPADKLAVATKKIGWAKRQWILLGVMAFFEAVILMLAFVFIISVLD